MAIGLRRSWSVLGLVVAGVVIGCGWKWREGRRHHRAITAIESEMAAGRHGIAARDLTKLLAWGRLDSDQVEYLLGVCEHARGRNQAAMAAWATVTPGSPFFARAILARTTMLNDSGQWAAAEQVIDAATQDPRSEPTALRILLLPIFVQQGRLEDAQRLIEERWDHLHETGEEASELAINLARLHIELRAMPSPIEAIRSALDQAGRLAPDDDRVWLGRANLAIRAGNPDEAQRWLEACQRRRPDDISVWRARLKWGMAASKFEAVRQALTHLQATESAPAESHRIAAWLAARQADPATERGELEQVSAAAPTDFIALDRQAELARQDGHPERAAELPQRRAAIARLMDRYQKLYERNQPIRDAAEMGRLAERLGHLFEARVFLSVASTVSLNRENLRDDLERVSRQCAQLAGRGTTSRNVSPGS